MLIYSMGVSVDGFIADRGGAFAWTVPGEEQFRFHIEQVRELGGYLCGRRLYETMLVWETDPSMRDNELGAAFADVWCAIPIVSPIAERLVCVMLGICFYRLVVWELTRYREVLDYLAKYPPR